MKSLMSMQLYRMIKNKSTWILIGVYIVLIIISVLTIVAMKFLAESDPSLQQAAASGGLILNSPLDVYISSFTGNQVSLIVSIFTVIFVMGLYSTSFIENICGQLKNKFYVPLSNIIIILLFNIALFIIGIGVTYFSMFLTYGSDLNMDIPDFALSAIGLQLLMNFTYSMFVLLITSIIRKTAPSMIVSILNVSLISLILWPLSDFLISAYVDTSSNPFKLSQFITSSNISHTTAQSLQAGGQDLVIKLLIITLVWLAVFVVTNYIVSKKKNWS